MGKFENKTIAIIGGGHIGQSLAQGLINGGKIDCSRVVVANPSLSKISHLRRQGVKITTNNREAVSQADWVILAVKPFVVEMVLSEISDLIKGKLVISLAAVVSIERLKRWSKDARAIRAMPNLAVSVNQGVIGLYADKIPVRDKGQVINLLSMLGMVVEVDKEGDLDTVTLLSGCGLAIVSRFMEFLTKYGTRNGLALKKSRTIAWQTFRGTVNLLEKSGSTADRLIKSVATKGGVTEAILNDMKQIGLEDRFIRAMDSGYTKIRELDLKLNTEGVI